VPAKQRGKKHGKGTVKRRDGFVNVAYESGRKQLVSPFTPKAGCAGRLIGAAFRTGHHNGDHGSSYFGTGLASVGLQAVQAHLHPILSDPDDAPEFICLDEDPVIVNLTDDERLQLELAS
jgi:hypothetical protein